jgi:hypothetical protein
MKILLLGEYSGVHNNLKAGLIKFGHEVVIMGDGDGYKNFNFDLPIAPYSNTIFSKLKNIFYILKNLPLLHKFDIVQIINPYIIPLHYFYTGLFYLIFFRTRKFIYYACGTDPNFLASKKSFSYFPFDDKNSNNYRHYNRWHLLYFHCFLKRIDSIASSCYTYRQGYLSYSNHKATIPLPSELVYPRIELDNPNEKIKILFGITRRDMKGAPYIEAALEKLRIHYSSLVDIRIVKNLSFSDFKKELDSSNILIDQCRSYDYGMSAIFALQRGIITLSGAESIAMSECFSIDCPVININPDSDQIYTQLELLCLMSPEERYVLKCRSQAWVRRFHDSLIVAQKFLNLYN